MSLSNRTVLKRTLTVCAISAALSAGLGSAPLRAQTTPTAPAAAPQSEAPVPVPYNELYPLGKAWPAPIVNIDVSQAPETRAWAEQARILVQQWFPIVCRFMDTKNYKPPKTLTLVFKDNMDGVAYTTGMGADAAQTVISAAWIKAHPDDFGMVIHEMTHVVQGYSDEEYGKAGWLVEGIADYIRFYKYEPEFPRSQVQPRDLQKATYHDAYRTTASFIAYVTWKYNRGLLFQLDKSLRAGNYSDALWQTITGKSVQDLWAEYVQYLTAQREADAKAVAQATPTD